MTSDPDFWAAFAAGVVVAFMCFGCVLLVYVAGYSAGQKSARERKHVDESGSQWSVYESKPAKGDSHE